MLTVLVRTISNSQVFLLKNVSSFCKCKSYSHFSAKMLAYMPYLMIKVLTIRYPTTSLVLNKWVLNWSAQSQFNLTRWNIMPCVWGVIFQWGSALKVSIKVREQLFKTNDIVSFCICSVRWSWLGWENSPGERLIPDVYGSCIPQVMRVDSCSVGDVFFFPKLAHNYIAFKF